MGFSNSFENSLQLLIFNNTNIANVGDATGLRGSSTAGSLYVALHTTDPGEAGDQTSNEATYTSYARVAVARSGSGFTVSGNSVSNAAATTFPAATGGSNTIQFFSIGVASSGASVIVAKGVLGSALGPFVGENSNDTITIKGHSLSVSDRVVFFAPTGATLPTGITEGVVYFVKTAADGDSITINSIATLGDNSQDRGASWTVEFVGRAMGAIDYLHNAAVAGQRSDHALARFDAYVAPHSPDAVLLTIGTNNIGAAMTLAAFLADLDAYKAKCDGIGARLIVGAIWPTDATDVVGRGATTRTWNNSLYAWAATNGVDVVPWESQADVFVFATARVPTGIPR